MNTTTQTLPSTSTHTGWHIGLWSAQIALAALYGMAVYMHVLMSPAELLGMGVAWAESAPIALIRFIGIVELAGVIGLIIPAATRIKPELTAYAAIGLLAIQALAIPFHVIRGEFSALPFNFIYVALALVIIWGRTRKAPIAARS